MLYKYIFVSAFIIAPNNSGKFEISQIFVIVLNNTWWKKQNEMPPATCNWSDSAFDRAVYINYVVTICGSTNF